MEPGFENHLIHFDIIFCLALACTQNTHSHTSSDYLHKTLWFFDNSCNNPSAVCLCSLYLRMVSMGSLQTFNTNFWLMVLILLPLTRTRLKRPGSEEEAKKFTHNFLRNQYTFPPLHSPVSTTDSEEVAIPPRL